MKRRLLLGGGKLLASALMLGLMGCGGAGIDEGMPKGDLTPGAKIDPKMTDMTGRSFKDTGAARSKADAAAKPDAAGGGAPAEKK